MTFLISDSFAAESATATSSADAVQAGQQLPYELSPQKTLMDTFGFLLILFVIFYFILIRPQQKRFKEHQAMVKGLQKGSKVMTGGGIIGTVVKLEGDDIALVEIAQGVRVRIARDTITQLMDGSASSETANDN